VIESETYEGDDMQLTEQSECNVQGKGFESETNLFNLLQEMSGRHAEPGSCRPYASGEASGEVVSECLIADKVNRMLASGRIRFRDPRMVERMCRELYL